jgi:large subunit ribosomal protein L27
MAHKKAGGSVKNGRDSVGQRLGVKVGDGQLVPAGSIIVRQRGQTFLAGIGTGLARDYTVFATVTGRVRFEYATKSKKRIRVISADEIAAAAARASAAADRAKKKSESKSTPAAKSAATKPAAKAAKAAPPRRAAKPAASESAGASPAAEA